MGPEIDGHDVAPSFPYLLYRYLRPFQYFRDVKRGGRYLPGFIAK